LQPIFRAWLILIDMDIEAHDKISIAFAKGIFRKEKPQVTKSQTQTSANEVFSG
jgi:hypothetical protein